ncbi:MAG TPA: DUF1861 family protein [Kofleriaceae bacterium]|nr:DUF1861 family protein [Kofleriaceae bacterium]
MRLPVSLLAALLLAAAVLTAAEAPAGAARTPRRVRLAGPGTARSASLLLRRYRRSGQTPRGKRLRFTGIGGRDVYNPTRPFLIGGRRVLAARVESRASETDSRVVFFEPGRSGWRPVEGAPSLALQDPFVTAIGEEVVLGGVEVQEAAGGKLRYRTVFHRGRSLDSLERFAAGPWGMKDIRVAPLADGRIFVLTRPQGRRGGRGKIAYTVVDSLDRLTPQALSRGRIIDGQFLDSEWGGANEIVSLGDDRFGVLGHIARYDARGDRHYYPVAFTVDARRGQVSELRTLVERRDLPGGLAGASKRSDLRDVLFSGGLDRHGDGSATLYVGAGDAEVHAVRIADPFR